MIRISSQSKASKIFILTLLAIAPILLLELVARALWHHQDSGSTRSGLAIPDQHLIWKLQPYPEGPLKTNELGFRDTPYNPKTEHRILLLGDSVAWGDGIEDINAIFPQQLQEMLSHSDTETFEIINSAVLGYSTFQQRRYLELYGMSLDPQLIVLQFCLNDVVERYSSLAHYGGDNVFLGVDTRHSMQGAYGFLMHNSRLFEGMARMAMGWSRDVQAYKVEKLASDNLSKDLTEAWEVTLAEIEGIRQQAAARNIPLLLVIAPYRFQLDDPEKLNQPQKVLWEYARAKNVEVIDLLPIFSQVNQITATPLFNDANHFSIEGHTLAAQALVEPIHNIIQHR
ncbi:MAG: SGNH/GDSL hydrolase family protein [Desulfobulbaceae bacterium]|nr:SGNH/GDSL hydrolase family protein [Desulfobulbaceae bacterium]